MFQIFGTDLKPTYFPDDFEYLQIGGSVGDHKSVDQCNNKIAQEQDCMSAKACYEDEDESLPIPFSILDEQEDGLSESPIKTKYARSNKISIGSQESQSPFSNMSESESLHKAKSTSKNILINYGTFLKNYMKSTLNSQRLKRFYEIFGKRNTYKSMARYTSLFRSQFQGECIEFFTFWAIRAIIKSNVTDKMSLLKYLGVLRQAAIRGELKNLQCRKNV